MNNPSKDGIKLTKEYYKKFLPTDLKWNVTKITDDFTLYDLFRLVYQAEVMVPDICAALGMSEFGAFWDQINLPRDPNDKDDVAYLELYWHPDFDIRTTPKKGLDSGGMNYWDDPKTCEMPNLMSFHGMGFGCPSKDYHECNDNCPKETPYGIEYSPINNLAHLPIRVSPKVEFYPPFVESDLEFHRTGFQLTIEPTLWCFIASILWELTFAGPIPNTKSMDKEND